MWSENPSIRPFVLRLFTVAAIGLVAHVVTTTSAVALNRRAARDCQIEKGVSAVIAGDSHTMWALDDSALPGVRNISLNAEGYHYTYKKLRFLFSHEPSIKVLYLGVSYHNFSNYFDDYIYGNLASHFIHRYLGLLSMADFTELAEANPGGIMSMSRAMVLRGLPAGLKERCSFYGRFPTKRQTQTFNIESTRERLRDQFFRDGQLRDESQSNLRYLNAILQLARTRDVRVVLLKTPLHPSYSEGVPRVYKTRFADFVERSGAEYYAFDDAVLPDSDFLPDGDHLNYRGAVRATEAFASYHARH